MLKHLLIFLFMLPLCCVAQFTISGRIINKADNQPIASASVFLSEATNGTASAKDGKFTISGVKPGRYTLVVSVVGYELYSAPIAITADTKAGDIALFVQTRALAEVTVKDDPLRSAKLIMFKEQFLGRSAFADQCQILNPDVLNIDYDENTKTLTAASTDFLEVENDALGYKLKYLLSDFMAVISPDTPSFKFRGDELFEPLIGSVSQQKRWEKARQEAYKNSPMHFYRALIQGRLNEEGFKIQQYAHYANPDRPSDSVIYAKIDHYEKLLDKVKGEHNVHDTLFYWKRELKISKYLVNLWPEPLLQTELLAKTNTPGIYAFGCEYDGLFVTYNEHHRFENFKVEHILNPKNTEATLIRFNTPYGFIDANGSVLNPYGISYAGVWFNYREADHLPVDYQPTEVPEAPVDSTVSNHVIAKLQDYAGSHHGGKVYLHFDKPYYAGGDTMYFKAYLTSDPNHTPWTGSGILHVDLISNAKIIQSINLATANGVAWGDLVLPDSVTKGVYRVRAYTRLMRNADNAGFFDKIIPVALGSAKGNTAANGIANTASLPSAAKPDIQFLPEGGSMISGIRLKVAFKSIGTNGLGIGVKGEIVDNDNKTAGQFSAAHLGMGYFYLNAEPGKTYKANVTYANGIQDVVSLPQASSSGITLAVDDSTDDMTVRLRTNAAYLQTNKGKDHTLIVYSGGNIISIITRLDSLSQSIALHKSNLHSGIAKFTLFSPQGEPLSERLVFIQNNDQLKITLNTAQTVYPSRGKVTLKANISNSDGQPVVGQFSVAVTDETKEPVDQPNENTILNNLLLTSDLKGYIEQPNYYFLSSSADAQSNLDILMLTQGYSGFEWKNVLNGKTTEQTYQPENSLSLSGNVKTLTGKPMNNAKVTLLCTSPHITRDTTTDASGNFKFTGLNFDDTTRLVISTFSKNNSSYARISINEPDYPAIIQIANPDSSANQITPDMVSAIKKQITEKGGSMKTGVVLNQVTIKNKNENPFTPHLTHSANLNGAGVADQVIMGDKLIGCTNLGLCLEALLHGVRFSGSATSPIFTSLRTPIALTGTTKAMVVIVDGVISDQNVLDNLTSTDVYSIEVLLKPYYLTIYGQAASGGAIVITMKHGGDANYNTSVEPNSVHYTFSGLYKAHTFYSPKYEAAAPPTHPDARTTIFWTPQVITDSEGIASFDFYNADTPGTYRVVMEGMDTEGNLGRQVYEYMVK